VKRLLARVVVLGTTIPVVIRKLRDSVEGDWQYERGEIRISKRIAARRLWEVFAHEVFHACESATDIERRLQEELDLTYGQARRVREVYAGTVVPVYLDTLERNGWLKRPDLKKAIK